MRPDKSGILAMTLGLVVLAAICSAGFGGKIEPAGVHSSKDRQQIHPAYVAVVDRRTPTNDGVLLRVQRDGSVSELLSTIGGDSLVRGFGRWGFLVADRRGARILHLGINGTVIAEYSLDAGGVIRDAVMVSAGTVWITRAQTNTLTVLDLATGKMNAGTDLSVVLEDEVVADPEMMHVHQGRVYVQLQRLDDDQVFLFAAHGAIAVIDIASGALVDAVDAEAGVQAIRLVGPMPWLKMHVTLDGSALLVSATGPRLIADVSGGLERIELATLSSSGFLVPEGMGNFGAFAAAAGGVGIGIFHTDIIAASHVIGFSTVSAQPVSDLIFEELFVTVESIEYDRASGQVLMPGVDGGMNEYDPVTGVRVRRVIFDEPPGFIRDFALVER